MIANPLKLKTGIANPLKLKMGIANLFKQRTASKSKS